MDMGFGTGPFMDIAHRRVHRMKIEKFNDHVMCLPCLEYIGESHWIGEPQKKEKVSSSLGFPLIKKCAPKNFSSCQLFYTYYDEIVRQRRDLYEIKCFSL